jgi:hypothetical protein
LRRLPWLRPHCRPMAEWLSERNRAWINWNDGLNCRPHHFEKLSAHEKFTMRIHSRFGNSDFCITHFSRTGSEFRKSGLSSDKPSPKHISAFLKSDLTEWGHLFSRKMWKQHLNLHSEFDTDEAMTDRFRGFPTAANQRAKITPGEPLTSRPYATWPNRKWISADWVLFQQYFYSQVHHPSWQIRTLNRGVHFNVEPLTNSRDIRISLWRTTNKLANSPRAVFGQCFELWKSNDKLNLVDRNWSPHRENSSQTRSGLYIQKWNDTLNLRELKDFAIVTIEIFEMDIFEQSFPILLRSIFGIIYRLSSAFTTNVLSSILRIFSELQSAR